MKLNPRWLSSQILLLVIAGWVSGLSIIHNAWLMPALGAQHARQQNEAAARWLEQTVSGLEHDRRNLSRLCESFARSADAAAALRSGRSPGATSAPDRDLGSLDERIAVLLCDAMGRVVSRSGWFNHDTPPAGWSVGDGLAGGPVFPASTESPDLGGLVSVGGRACLFARQPIGDRLRPDGSAVFISPINKALLGELAKTTGVGVTVIDLPVAPASRDAARVPDRPAAATVAAGTLSAETSLQDSLGQPIGRLRVSGSVADLDRAAANMQSAYLVQLFWLLAWGLVTFAAVYLLFIRPLAILVRRLSAPDVANQRSGLATGLFAEAGILAGKFAGVMGRIVELSQIDGLTGLINRRQFQILLDHEFHMSQRHGSALAMMMIDVDRFKRVNDTFGHLVGDEVLAMVARAVADATRRSDVCARYGGEEFAVILPHTTMEQALPIAERIRGEIARRVVLRNPNSIKVTASIGVASIPQIECGRPEHLVDAADRAMYLAKRLGRDRAALASDLPPAGAMTDEGSLAEPSADAPATGSPSASAAG